MPSFDLTVDGTGAVQNVVEAKAGEGAGTYVYKVMMQRKLKVSN